MENVIQYECVTWVHTVDGSEIRRSPVEVGSLSQYLQGFTYIPGGFLAGFQPSTVLLNFASRFYFGLAMFHHFAVIITPLMKQTRFFSMNLFFSAPIIFNYHHKYGHSIIGICLWWSV